MAHGRNNGKKLMAVRIIAHAFEIVSSKPTCRASNYIRIYPQGHPTTVATTT